MKNKNKQSVGVLLTLSSIPLIMVLGNSMIIPVLPDIETQLKIGSFQVSLLITVFSISAALIIPISGMICDRIGRKWVIAGGLTLYGIGGLMAGFTPLTDSYTFLLIARIIQGIGAAGTGPIAMVLVGDLFDKAKRSHALGVIEASNAIGKVLSPILGSILGLISYNAMFFLFPFLAIPIIFFLFKLIKEPIHHKKKEPLSQYSRNVRNVFSKNGQWLSITFSIGLLTMFTLFGILFYLSNLLEKSMSIDGLIKGCILAIPLLGLCLSAYLTGLFIKEAAPRTKGSLICGLFLLILATPIMIFAKNIYFLMSLAFIVGAGSGLVLPCLNLLVTSSAELKQRGIVTSLYNSVRFYGVAFGPLAFGIIQVRTLFTTIPILLGSLLILTFAFIHPKKQIDHLQ